jgi:hypothetical protein
MDNFFDIKKTDQHPLTFDFDIDNEFWVVTLFYKFINHGTVRIVTRLRAGLIPYTAKCFYLPQRPDRLWDPPSLLTNGYRDFLLWSKAARA